MRTRSRFAVIAAAVVALAALVALFFVAKLILSDDWLLLDHVSERRTTLTEIALWADADPNYRDEDGRSALPVAVEHGDSEIVPLLLDAGADADARTSDGEPVAALAARDGEAEILEFLLGAGADPNAKDESGIAVLVGGVIHGDAEIVQMLLEAGADPNGPGIAELARRSGNADLVKLLEAGALTAEALLTLAELGLNALGNIDTFIEGMLCIFTLGLGC